ncbi:MAG: chorismate synthase [Candidatus Caldatribacteriaceae bacterium]
MKLAFRTAGESHGPSMVVLIEGLPSNLLLEPDFIHAELARRRKGIGKSPRMEIEEDQIEIMGGVRWKKTLGGPVAIRVINRDYKNWVEKMDPLGDPSPEYQEVTIPRPGHADLGGMVKYRFQDLRNVIERASARETVARCVAGALAKLLLRHFGVTVGGFVESIGPICAQGDLDFREKLARAGNSVLATFDPVREQEMIALIERVKEEGDTLGGRFMVAAFGVVPGLGSYVQWEERLDAQLAFSLMSIPGVKGVEIGEGFRSASLRGSELHDAILYDPFRTPWPYFRQTNRSGGIEGGISTGETIWVRCAMKPIPTLRQGLQSVDMKSKELTQARYERSDVCAVPRALVVGEAMMSWIIASFYREKFGGDSLEEMMVNFQSYLSYLETFKK